MLNDILKKDADLLTRDETVILTTAVIKQLMSEFEHHDKGGLYGYIQRNMAYNSNRIEGSRLTEDETALLFETGELLSTGEIIYRAKDIEEMTGHFLMFNQMLKTISEPLSVDMIKDFHYQLEAGVFEFRANGYVPGEYKKRENTVAGITTSHPQNVSIDMENLLSTYHEKDGNILLNDLATFHANYEIIHPFQDGNGRTGRMILFRESLYNGNIPIIIRDENKTKYYMALKTFQNNKNATKLEEYFAEEQKHFYTKMRKYMYDYSLDNTSYEEFDI